MDSKLRVLLFLAPELRTSGIKVARLLMRKGCGYDCVFLDFPRELEMLVNMLAKDQLSLTAFLDIARRDGLIPEPISTWLYFNKPILEFLPRIKKKYPHLGINCYGIATLEHASMEMAVKLANLTLRTTVRGKIESSVWRDALQEAVEAQKSLREAEAENITRKLKGKSLCVSDMNGRRLGKPLRKAGIHIGIRYCERPYHFPPLKILNRVMARRRVEDCEIERYVKAHLNYIQSYIYRYNNRNRAYYEWVNDKITWMRRKLDPDEIKALDRIIQ